MSFPETTLPRYKCHKVVEALQIAKVHLLGKGLGATFVPVNQEYSEFDVSHGYLLRNTPEPGGYFVRYEDGYTSFSPQEAFENGYTEISGHKAPEAPGPNVLPPIETVAAVAHQAWIDVTRSRGITSRRMEGAADGEEQMVPYTQLSEKAKEFSREAVRRVYEAIQTLR